MRYFLLNSNIKNQTLLGSKTYTTTPSAITLSENVNNFDYIMITLTIGSNQWTNTLTIPKVLGYDKHYVVTVYHGASYIYAIDANMTSTAFSFAKSTSTTAWDSVEKTVRVIGLMK